jgi:hypothetical protein
VTKCDLFCLKAVIRFNEALNVVSDINVSGYLFWLSAPSLVSEADKLWEKLLNY